MLLEKCDRDTAGAFLNTWLAGVDEDEATVSKEKIKSFNEKNRLYEELSG